MLYLASKSPRRRQLLEQLGIEFGILEANIDESWDGREHAGDFVVRLALEKARAGKLLAQGDRVVIAADTEVVLDHQVLGKPKDPEDAAGMLQKLSGRTHHVYSGVAVINKDKEFSALNISRVSFRPLTIEECRNYCSTGEPMDKAGAYAIQGRAAAFISRLEGSYSGVMGLPLFETSELLKGTSEQVPPGLVRGRKQKM